MKNPRTVREGKGRQRGSAVLELALVMPWLLFLFAGAMDMGFYAYALIATQNAARVAALYTSSGTNTVADSTGACQYALTEMNMLPNVSGLSSCSGLPLTVTASSVTGPDGQPASQVSVTYQSVQLIPIPGLMGRLTVTRTVQMRVNSLS